MEATGWEFLPHAGGLLDQPEALMQDIMEISSAYIKLRKLREKPNEF